MNKPMSIKDRIRAMNLEAERSSIHNIGYNKAVTPPSAFTKRKNTEVTSSTQSNTPKSHSSYEEETNAMAINVWRRRTAKDEKQDDEGTDVAEWNLSDLRKGTLAAATTSSSTPMTTSEQSVPVTPEEPKQEVKKEKPHHKNSFKNNYIQNLGRTSPIPRSSPITVSSPSWKFRSKLKPITRAPHTLALVQAMTTPPRHAVEENKIKDEGEEQDNKIQTKWNRNAVSMSPKKLALGSKFQRDGSESIANNGNASVSSFPVENTNKGRNALSMSPRKVGKIGLVNLQTFEKNTGNSVYSRNAVSMSPRRVNAFQSVSLKKVEKKVEEQVKTVQEEAEEMPMDELMDNSVASVNSVSSQPENEISNANNTQQQEASQHLIKRTPNRSKISDRIKAFSSAANGQSWKQKQQQSPRYTYPMPPSSIKRHNMQKYAHTSQQEDSSCASSERQSEKDDDSISVLTPMANHTPARLGAQPPTPNSYNSAYTSVASSGDGAVAGSFASQEQNISNQMFYSHMSTPSSSVQGDSNPLNHSNSSGVKNEDKVSTGESGVASPKHGQIVVTMPKQKNTLQSKLENDKQKAFARRARMMNRMQNKMPSELVAAQKKAQDGQVTRKWGVKTPNRDGVDSPSTRGTPGSIDADPTMNEVEVNVNAKKSVPSTISKKKKVQASQAERPNTPTSGKMKAHLMKKLIHKRRQRRNQIHDSNSTADRPNAPLPSPAVQAETAKPFAKKEESSISDYCIRSRRIDRDLLMKAKSRKEAIVKIPIVKPKASVSEPKEPLPVKEEKENRIQPVVEETVFDESPMKPLTPLKEKETKGKEDITKHRDEFLPPPPPPPRRLPQQTVPQTQQLDEEDIPPLPPVIIRSTQNTSKDDSLNVSSQDIAEKDSSANIDEKILPMQEVLNDSVSVASSLLNEEGPDDEYDESFEYEDQDDEPEPVVDSFIVEDNYDEPEPAVDSFITDDLSPIRQNEVSKHALENSAFYQNSPSKMDSPEQSPEQRPGHIRDLITSQSTPVHANRHASLRNVGEMLFDPQGTPLESSFFEASAPVSPKMKPRISYKEAEEMFDADQQSNDPKTFRNHCADAFSDVSSARSGSTTSATSSAVSNAHRIIAERRARKNKEFEPTVESPKSNVSIEGEDNGTNLSIAQDLARKIMSSDADTSCSSLNEGNRKHLRGTEAIKEALLANRSSDVEASPMRVNQTADTDPASMSPSVDHGNDQDDDCSDSLEIIDTSMDEDNTSIDGKGDLKTRVHVIPLSPETNQSMNSTTSELDMDMDNSIFDETTLDQSTADQTTLLEDGCQYPKPSFLSKPLTNFSDMVCGQTDDVDTSKEESLNTSTVSAVRISHIEEEDDDLPFDESCNEAVEVEYISNDTTTMQNETNMTNVTKSVFDDSSMLLNITKDLIRQNGEDHDFSNTIDYTNPNYISESSCDTSLDEIDYQISVYNR